MSQFKSDHITYFESPAGIELLTMITALLDDNHRKAEDDPNLARDYMQRAKGVRETLDAIDSMTISVVQPKVASR